MKNSNYSRYFLCLVSIILFSFVSPHISFAQTAEELYQQASYYKYNNGDIDMAKQLYRQAAEKGHPKAQYEVAMTYRFDENDCGSYIYWIKKSAEQGYSEAMWHLAMSYWNGGCITENKNIAVIWFKRTAEKNDDGPASTQSTAASFVAFYYEDLDRDEAIKWYKKTADIYYAKFNKLDQNAISKLKEWGIDYNPITKATSSSSSNSYASHSTSSNSQSHKSSTISKSSTQKSNSSQRTTSRPINWATDVIMPPVIDFSNMPFNSVETYPVVGGYSGTIDGGSYNSGGGANSSNSASRCTWCNGTGKVVKNDNAPANFGISKPKQRCPECGEIYDPNVRNHYHQTCSHCHGTGLR